MIHRANCCLNDTNSVYIMFRPQVNVASIFVVSFQLRGTKNSFDLSTWRKTKQKMIGVTVLMSAKIMATYQQIQIFSPTVNIHKPVLGLFFTVSLIFSVPHCAALCYSSTCYMFQYLKIVWALKSSAVNCWNEVLSPVNSSLFHQVLK